MCLKGLEKKKKGKTDKQWRKMSRLAWTFPQCINKDRYLKDSSKGTGEQQLSAPPY